VPGHYRHELMSVAFLHAASSREPRPYRARDRAPRRRPERFPTLRRIERSSQSSMALTRSSKPWRFQQRTDPEEPDRRCLDRASNLTRYVHSPAMFVEIASHNHGHAPFRAWRFFPRSREHRQALGSRGRDAQRAVQCVDASIIRNIKDSSGKGRVATSDAVRTSGVFLTLPVQHQFQLRLMRVTPATRSERYLPAA